MRTYRIYIYTLTFREREAKKHIQTVRKIEDLKNGKESADVSGTFLALAQRIRKRKLDGASSLLPGKWSFILSLD